MRYEPLVKWGEGVQGVWPHRPLWPARLPKVLMLGRSVGLPKMEKLTRVLRLCCGPRGTGFFDCAPCDWVRGVFSDTLLVVEGASRQPRALGTNAPKRKEFFTFGVGICTVQKNLHRSL